MSKELGNIHFSYGITSAESIRLDAIGIWMSSCLYILSFKTLWDPLSWSFKETTEETSKTEYITSRLLRVVEIEFRMYYLQFQLYAHIYYCRTD